MILWNPKAPLVFGTVMIGLLAVYLTFYHPTPGPLAESHTRAVTGVSLAACEVCHTKGGLVEGCLSCHSEIRKQIEIDEGYHAFLLRGRTVACAPCHPDHLGSEFSLVSLLSWDQQDPNLFNHPHVRFVLDGAHKNLACDSCHRRSVPFLLPDFPLQPRDSTYLGLTQDCIGCHEDVHAGTLARSCELCHGQDAFRPAIQFRHDDYYVLEGAHAGAACLDCHLRADPNGRSVSPIADVNEMRVAFDKVKGKACADCHETPHRTRWPGECTECHLASDKTWAGGTRGIRPETHALTGFPLDEAHVSVACEKCHVADGTYERRYPNPSAVGYGRRPGMCEGCHEDSHGGQFRDRYTSCAECHAGPHFKPSQFDVARHEKSYSLTGPHATVACEKCHPVDPNTRIQRFVSVPRQCDACHADPHGDQFRGRYPECTDCHSGEHFKPSLFDPVRHEKSYPLTGPHAAVACEECHPVDPSTQIRQFVSVSRRCDACHRDPHGGQFLAHHAQCTDCHEQERFLPARYDLSRHATLYPLTGAHAAVPCIRCHLVSPTTSVRRFASTDRECQACHSDPHAGQFARQMATGDCTTCHRQDAGTFDIRPYDHARQTRYPLTGAHARAECGDCHRPQRVGEGNGPFLWTRVYAGTPTACDACHADIHRGQFRENGRQDCERCHSSTEVWTTDRFEHNRDARFTLEGVHVDLACSACHPSVRQPDGQNVVQYRPLGTRCEDCHGITPK